MYLLIELNLSYNQYITVSLSKNMYSPPTVSRLDTIFIFCVIFSLRLHLMYIDGQHEHMQNNIVQEVDSALFFSGLLFGGWYTAEVEQGVVLGMSWIWAHLGLLVVSHYVDGVWPNWCVFLPLSGIVHGTKSCHLIYWVTNI